MDRQTVFDYIKKKYKVLPEYPWRRYDSNAVFRHNDNKKWFALIMRIRREQLTRDGDKTPVDVMNLKIDPIKGRPEREGVYPAYHMNHKSWITVTLDERLSDDAVMTLIESSFATVRIGGRQ